MRKCVVSSTVRCKTHRILNNMPKKLQKLAVTFGNSLRSVESANWRT